ncbi:hypothetical protein D1AOALGA4SA_4646 [Olavius algarvensis Delta 1 endosymbiont]|nr:hypothetical protein D1AOALGA4SA_4646 [Olavius algarvensis Delta 1 endosymbiont]
MLFDELKFQTPKNKSQINHNNLNSKSQTNGQSIYTLKGKMPGN